MSEHRRTQDSVSNDVHDHNPDHFDPPEALQRLYGEVVQLEALAHAASEAVAQLPFPADREERRVFERVYTMVTMVAENTNAAVRFGGELMDALGAYLKGQPTEDGATETSNG
jgi:hypothetical protein